MEVAEKGSDARDRRLGKKHDRRNSKSSSACPAFLLSGFLSTPFLFQLPGVFLGGGFVVFIPRAPWRRTNKSQPEPSGSYLVHLPVRAIPHQFHQLEDAGGILERQKKGGESPGLIGRRLEGRTKNTQHHFLFV